ncbi:four-carbon acid sugar kinase family protein [Cryobacterium sp. Y62]|uniref:four-carbon acid sugar kinase family protein n=1 Tax=Cryobacterium sp. Y62 TaxID=2048284 RepID=UPI000CE4556E|nr:four-carbon acid sugar kinase family protein [Cryobacterium sp. Y62]
MTRIAFLADDLTGGADVLAQANAFGLQAVMVLDPAEAVNTNADVVGVAGAARSLSGLEFDQVVTEALNALRDLQPDVLIYKVCSTFDSSPTIGSIGRAIELLHQTVPTAGPIPVVPAQPGFGRYTAFAQHFGTYGDAVHRLDRHPVMSHHPSTPMTEADLRIILSLQLRSGTLPGLIDLGVQEIGDFAATWAAAVRGTNEAFVVDAINETHMDNVARELLSGRPSLVVGSGGIMSALARTLTGETRQAAPDTTTASGPVLVVSASASRTSGDQIKHAVANGFVSVPIPPESIGDDSTEAIEWIEEVLQALRDGRDVVAHTACGPDDPRLQTRDDLTASLVGGTMGRVAAEAARRGLSRDIVIAGGDTSSHALAAAGVNQIRMSEQFVTAGPICVADDNSGLGGCRLLLKGGQVGPIDVFTRFRGVRASR